VDGGGNSWLHAVHRFSIHGGFWDCSRALGRLGSVRFLDIAFDLATDVEVRIVKVRKKPGQPNDWPGGRPALGGMRYRVLPMAAQCGVSMSFRHHGIVQLSWR
jgi:hypothetical protein